MMLFRFVQPWIIVVVAVIDSTFLLTSTHWLGNFTNAVEWANGGLFVAGPLLVGATAFASQRYVSLNAQRLFGLTSTKISGRVVGSIFISTAVNGLAAHLLTIIAALVSTVLPWPSAVLAAPSLVYVLLPVVLYAGLATAVAVLVPNRWGVFVGVGATLILQYLTMNGSTAGLFVFGGAYETVGYQYSGPAQLVFIAISVTLAGVSLVAAVGGLGKHVRARTAVVILLSAIILTAGKMPIPERMIASASATPQVCSSGRPSFCVAEGHTRQFDDIVVGLTRAASALRESGVVLKARYEEPLAGHIIPKTVGSLNFGVALNTTPISDQDYAAALSVPMDCPELRARTLSARGTELLAEQTFAKYWIMYKLGENPDVAGAWSYSSVPDRVISELYAALSSCSTPPEVLKVLRTYDSSNFADLG